MRQHPWQLAQLGTIGLHAIVIAAALSCNACHGASRLAPPGPAAGSGPAGGNGPAGGSGPAAGTGPTGGTAPAAPPTPPGSLSGDASAVDPDVRAYAAALQTDLVAARKQSASELAAQHPLPFAAALTYDPMQAQGLTTIQSSALALQGSELTALTQHGFAISSRQQYPTFTYGYATIYSQDLPVYISADSILDALHSSYQALLKDFETMVVKSELGTLLDDLRATLSARPDSAIKADVDVYLAVAQALLAGGARSDTPAAAQPIIALAVAAAGPANVHLFGADHIEDFSQYVPRGHYTDTLDLQNYFRAMMWLGRYDLRLVETQDDKPVVNRPQVEATLLLGSLFDPNDLAHYQRIDETLRLFVGESDNMTVSQVSALQSALGLSDLTQLAAVSDAALLQTILSHGFGKQQILNQLVTGGIDHAVPLSASFLLLGQRFTVDSNVLSNVVWDRTRAMRMMPDPLDAAFAAFGNDQALTLLADQLTKYDYAGDLSAMRTLADHYDDAFWHANLYNDWLSALRALSPTSATLMNPSLPQVASGEAWGRRILNTQLASWAELRHDTILYNKQSYTSGAVCEFPDAAVDPYPEFYAAIGRFAAHGDGLSKLLSGTGVEPTWLESVSDYFAQLTKSAAILKSIADTQAMHAQLSAEQLAFVNDAVVVQRVPAGCTTIDVGSGWYPKLYFSQGDVLAFAPTIADVHTQPTDEAGDDVGRILHVGTGLPRLLVVTLDGCSGARAYAGLAASYYEQTTEDWKRLTDAEWTQTLMQSPPLAPKWLTDLLAQP